MKNLTTLFFALFLLINAGSSLFAQGDLSDPRIWSIVTLNPNKEVHVSDWLTVTQEMIDDFARATRDHQWIHVDAKRAAQDSPYKSSIAHGYLTLSLYPYPRGLVDEAKPLFPGVRNVINYGINKLRFPAAVPVGSRIRARCKIINVENVKNSLELTEEYTVEVEGQPRPACVAECVMRLYF